jgi:hypothetical protein
MATIHKVNCNLYKKYICHHLLLFMVLSATPVCEACQPPATKLLRNYSGGLSGNR